MENGTEDSGLDRYPISELWEDFAGRDDAMAIPHIGGRYGNLDYYHPEINPVIEIHSHHGTFEWFAQDAMRRGLKVGFIATSDDHTCRPGLSYPLQRFGIRSFDVKSGFTAVYADQLQKEDIWKAIKSRHCYATTFARIILDVQSNGHGIGDELTTSQRPELKINVVGTAPLDYIEINRGCEVVKRISMDAATDHVKKSLKITWGGVRVKTRLKHADWAGSLYLDKGRLLKAETFAFDRCDQGLKLMTANTLQWDSSTSGDVDGLVIQLDAESDATIHFHTKLVDFTIPVADITDDVTCYDVGGINLRVELQMVSCNYLAQQDDLRQYTAAVSYVDESPEAKEAAYWVKVQQKDGHTAWSSPLFITYTPS